MTYQLHHGNCLDIMPMIDRESIDAIVTDPPYGLGFMGKDWDHGVPGEHFWREAYRVAKPGAHLLAFGGTRTFHRLTCAIEDAGWEIRDCVMWVYGSGFPKSHDASKAIDREAGLTRDRIPHPRGKGFGDGVALTYAHDAWTTENAGTRSNPDPLTEAAAEWQGWGTALKPAWEPIIVARKPLAGTVAENVQRYGTGAINVDACRIETGDDTTTRHNSSSSYMTGLIGATQPIQDRYTTGGNAGRWPANLIHDGSAEVLAGFPIAGSNSNVTGGESPSGIFMGTKTRINPHDTRKNGGSAARFFYCAKASKADRDEGCEDLEEQIGTVGNKWTDQDYRQGDSEPSVSRRNHHPTVKPTALMRYLCRLVTPPAGVILDPFMGSGSTGKAAILEGFNFVGIDTEQEYIEIAARRIEYEVVILWIMVLASRSC